MQLVRRTAVLLLALPLAAGCASYAGVRFQPSPLDVRLVEEQGGAAVGRALVTVRGIRRAEPDGWELALRLRLENQGEQALELLPEQCVVVDAALEALDPPRVARRDAGAGAPLAVAPGATATFVLVAPFPSGREPGDHDLEGLNLRWAVRSGADTVTVSSSFERVPDRSYVYRDPWYPWGWYGPYWTYGRYHPVRAVPR